MSRWQAPSDPEALSQYLAVKVWQWQDGETAGVLLWLQQIGCRITLRSEGGWTLRGLAGATSSLYPGMDPIATASSMGMLLGGTLWPFAFPDFLRAVTTEWTRRTHHGTRSRNRKLPEHPMLDTPQRSQEAPHDPDNQGQQTQRKREIPHETLPPGLRVGHTQGVLHRAYQHTL